MGLLKPSIAGRIALHRPTTTIGDMKFMIIPALHMSCVVKRPVPNTTALTGVAMGSMKAQDAQMIVGISSRKGLRLGSTAVTLPRIGMKILEVAVFDVASVRKTIT